jgi:hypothetical protein
VIEDAEVFEQVEAVQVGTVVEPTKVTEAKSQHHQHKHPTHRPSRETPLSLQKHCSGCKKDLSHCEKIPFQQNLHSPLPMQQSQTNIVYRAKNTICCEGNLFSHCQHPYHMSSCGLHPKHQCFCKLGPIAPADAQVAVVKIKPNPTPCNPSTTTFPAAKLQHLIHAGKGKNFRGRFQFARARGRSHLAAWQVAVNVT